MTAYFNGVSIFCVCNLILAMNALKRYWLNNQLKSLNAKAALPKRRAFNPHHCSFKRAASCQRWLYA